MKSGLDKLDVLVGEWQAEANAPRYVAEPVRGRTTFEWLEGNLFLIQRAEVEHPDFPDSISIIGWDEDAENGVMHYFDSRGVVRRYDTNLVDGVWTVSREDPDFAQRYVGALSEDGRQIVGAWERSDDGSTWEHDFDLTYTKRD